jgi:hypothetical protein
MIDCALNIVKSAAIRYEPYVCPVIVYQLPETVNGKNPAATATTFINLESARVLWT